MDGDRWPGTLSKRAPSTTRTSLRVKQIKADVAVEDVLAHYGVHLRRITATHLRGRCPLPMHTSTRSRDSFAVNVARNVWSCRSQSCMQARGGRVGGNVLDLVALMEGCGLREAALRLQAWCGSGTSHTATRRGPPPEPEPEPNRPLGFALRYVDPRHPYLSARGLTAATARAFGIGAYSGKGLLRRRIVIPIHNERGDLIAYAGRAIGDEEPKYRFPAGFRKSLVLFNLHRALATGVRCAIVVEGFFDTLVVHQAGYPAVVGLMGSMLSRYQADLLAAHFDRAVLMLDGDEAGRQGAVSVARTLGVRMSVAAVSVEDGCQPDQLAPAVIHQLVCNAGIDRPLEEHAWSMPSASQRTGPLEPETDDILFRTPRT